MGNRKFLAVVLLCVCGHALAQPGGTSQGPLLARSMSVTPFTGQTVRVVLEARSCDGSPVGFIADNVAISGGSTLLNGSFESGLSDWDADPENCTIDAFEEGDAIGYNGDNAAPAPTNGTLLAASGADSPGRCRLSQDVAITGAGTLTADVGWTFTRFAPTNPGCRVSLRLEQAQGGAVLDEIVVFDPNVSTSEIPSTPLWALALLSGLLAVFGWRRLGIA